MTSLISHPSTSGRCPANPSLYALVQRQRMRCGYSKQRSGQKPNQDHLNSASEQPCRLCSYLTTAEGSLVTVANVWGLTLQRHLTVSLEAHAADKI